MQVKQAGDPRRYEVRDAKCLGRKCFNPGGYRYSDDYISWECMSRVNKTETCPEEPYSTYHDDIACARRAAGWEVVE